MTTKKTTRTAWTPADPESVKTDRWSGMSLTEIAKKYGISNVDLLRKWLTREGVTLTREQIQANTKRVCATKRVDPGADALIALTEQNLPRAEIADRLGISESSIGVYKRKHDVSVKQQGPKAAAHPAIPTPTVPEPKLEALDTKAEAAPPYRGWTPANPDAVKADRLSGMRISDIVVNLRKQPGSDQNATIDKVSRWLVSEGVILTQEQVDENRKRLHVKKRADQAEKRATLASNQRVESVESQPPAPKQAIQPQGWTPADPEAVRSDRRNGKTLNEIIVSIKAQDASVTIEKLRKWLLKEGIVLTQEQIKENSKRLYAEKQTVLVSSGEPPKIGKAPSVTNKPNAQSRDPGREVLDELAKSGMTRLEIAAKVGVSDSTISTYLLKHGITTTGKSSDDPPRRKIREALATSPTKESAADKLGISRTALDRLIKRHRITGAGNAGRESSKRAMTEKARASISETRANAAQQTKIVGTDTRAMIDAAIAAGMVTKYPPAFCAETTRDPLSEEDRKKLFEYRKSRNAA